MIICSDEQQAKRKLAEFCTDEQDITILKSTSSRYKKVQQIILTSADMKDIEQCKGYVFIGVYYKEGFQNTANCKSPVMEAWPAVHSSVLCYLSSTQSNTLNITNCGTGMLHAMSPWFDAYYSSTSDERYSITLPAEKFAGLHSLLQLRLEVLLLCNNSNDFAKKLALNGNEQMTSFLDMRTKMYTFYDAISFELMCRVVEHYKNDIVQQHEWFLSLWQSMEQKLMKYRMVFNFIEYNSCDLSIVTLDFLTKRKQSPEEESTYSYNKDEIHMLPRDSRLLLDRILESKEDKSHLSLIESVLFATTMACDRVGSIIKQHINKSRYAGAISSVESILDSHQAKDTLPALYDKCFQIIMKYCKERVSTGLGNIIKTYDMDSLKEETAEEKDLRTLPKISAFSTTANDVLPGCIKKIIQSDKGYKNTFIFQFMESSQIDIEDLCKDRPEWTNAIHKQQLYIKKNNATPFIPSCSWMMRNEMCTCYTKSSVVKPKVAPYATQAKKKIKLDDEAKEPVDIHYVSGAEFVETMKKCKTQRNRGFRNPDDKFHKTPLEYIQKRRLYTKHHKKFIEKEPYVLPAKSTMIGTITTSSSSSSSSTSSSLS